MGVFWNVMAGVGCFSVLGTIVIVGAALIAERSDRHELESQRHYEKVEAELQRLRRLRATEAYQQAVYLEFKRQLDELPTYGDTQ